MGKDNNNLEELENLEGQAKGSILADKSAEDKPNIIDGYKTIDKYMMPFEGKLYPESWQFAYRCPTSKEVANFSTINEKDQPAIIQAVEDLIQKCVIIFDTEKEQKLSSLNVNDGDKIFFMLLLRDFYLPGNDISFPTMCMFCKDSVEASFNAYSLKYKPLTEKMLENFDGRVFHLTDIPGVNQPIDIHVPTLATSSKILRYVVKVYRESSSDSDNKADKYAFDKQFLLVAPFLFETGDENIAQLKQKFQRIVANEELLKAYVNIANQLKLDNLETFDYTCSNCGSTEEAQLKFPGGWKNMFINKNSLGGYF